MRCLDTEDLAEAMDEGEAAAAGSVAACVARLARHEQRALLGLVPLPRLPSLLAQVLKDCFATLANDVEVSSMSMQYQQSELKRTVQCLFRSCCVFRFFGPSQADYASIIKGTPLYCSSVKCYCVSCFYNVM